MFFCKVKINGAYEFLAVTENGDSLFAYWCQLDNNRNHANDHAVIVEGDRFIVGYHEMEEPEHYTKVEPSEIDNKSLAAIMFAMSSDFNASSDDLTTTI